MDIHQLESFAVVADSGSYTKAAANLFRTRQALSKAVKQLENELGFSLFAIDDGRIELTDEGSRFRQEIRPLLDEYYSLDKRYGGQSRSPTCNIAMAPGLFDVVENNKVAIFFNPDSAIHLSIEESHSDGILDMVRTGASEIGLLGTHRKYLQEFDYFAIAHPGFHVLVPAEHPFASQIFLDITEIDGQPFVTLGKHNHLQDFFIEECERVGVHPKILFETTEINLRDIWCIEERALTFACSPKSLRPQYSTVCLPFGMSDAQIFGTYVIKRKGSNLSPDAWRVWNCLKEYEI